ncbi:hypothetical protein [Streptomyces mutabilis]|uniref:hypothetical protein n=1 Tax=Streptomyces mutabilis TaxID=67332 RepID=UPI0017866BD3|nr:hypothetical protein [Streptomyces mutabilis]
MNVAAVSSSPGVPTTVCAAPRPLALFPPSKPLAAAGTDAAAPTDRASMMPAVGSVSRAAAGR